MTRRIRSDGPGGLSIWIVSRDKSEDLYLAVIAQTKGGNREKRRTRILRLLTPGYTLGLRRFRT